MLDCIDIAIFIVDKNLQIFYSNHCGDQLLALRDGLQMRHGRLLGSLPNETFLMTCLVKKILQKSLLEHIAPPMPLQGLVLSRPSLRRPLELAAKRLAKTPDEEDHFLFFVSDPERAVRGSLSLLKNIYDFTPAESRLAFLLMNGHTLDSAAHKLAVAKETVRKQVQNLFSKTRTNRQGELVRLLVRGVFRIN